MFTSRKAMPLTNLNVGESGIVGEMLGGRGMVRRLEALGVRAGKKIKKLGGIFMRGPVTVQVGNTQVSIGYGMASRIMVEVER
jgi:ferrous iron transport protein A